MNIIHRYIVKQVMVATAFVFIIVSAMSFIVGLLKELHDISGEYGFQQAVLHDLLLLPYSIYQLFPMMVLLGGVLGLGMLASSHELIVMRTAGVSVRRIAWGVLSAALLLIIIATFGGEFLAPKTNAIAEIQKSIVKTHGQAVATKSGVWIHEGNNFLHVERVIGLQHLEGITRYEFDNEHHLLATYFAKSMDYKNGQWLLHHLIKTTISLDQILTQPFPLATWSLTITPNLLNVGLIEPEAMSLPKLAEYTQYLVNNRLQSGGFRLAFWQRLFQPLTTLVMILLAIPFVFAAPRSVTMGRQVLFAIIIGFIFYMLNAFIGQFSVVFLFPPFIAALLPTVIFALIGYGLMFRVKV